MMLDYLDYTILIISLWLFLCAFLCLVFGDCLLLSQGVQKLQLTGLVRFFGALRRARSVFGQAHPTLEPLLGRAQDAVQGKADVKMGIPCG